MDRVLWRDEGLKREREREQKGQRERERGREEIGISIGGIWGLVEKKLAGEGMGPWA